MRGAGALIMLGALFALGSSGGSSSGGGSSGGSSSGGSSSGGSSSGGSSSGGSSSGEPPPTAQRTGLDGRDAWARYAREVEALARAQLERDGAPIAEQLAGAHAIAALALSENSGRHEYAFNPGNLRPVGDQARARWPNGLLYRAFPTRAAGVEALVRLLRQGSRYRDAWAQLAQLAAEGEPLEPLIGAWFAAIHDRGYTEGPSDPAAREAWLAGKVRTGIGVADLVSRALAQQPAPREADSVQAAMAEPAAAVTGAARALFDRVRSALGAPTGATREAE